MLYSSAACCARCALARSVVCVVIMSAALLESVTPCITCVVGRNPLRSSMDSNVSVVVSVSGFFLCVKMLRSNDSALPNNNCAGETPVAFLTDELRMRCTMGSIARPHFTAELASNTIARRCRMTSLFIRSIMPCSSFDSAVHLMC